MKTNKKTAKKSASKTPVKATAMAKKTTKQAKNGQDNVQKSRLRLEHYEHPQYPEYHLFSHGEFVVALEGKKKPTKSAVIKELQECLANYEEHIESLKTGLNEAIRERRIYESALVEVQDKGLPKVSASS